MTPIELVLIGSLSILSLCGITISSINLYYSTILIRQLDMPLKQIIIDGRLV